MQDFGDGTVAPSAKAARLNLRKVNLLSAALGRPVLVLVVLLAVMTLAHVLSAKSSSLYANLILVGAAFVLAIYAHEARAAKDELTRGAELIVKRKFETALAVLQPLALTSPLAYVRARATALWGTIARATDRHADADMLLRQIIDTGWARRQHLPGLVLGIHWSLAYADLAIGKLEEARQRIEAGKAVSDADAVEWYLVEALFLARSERWEELVDWLSNRTSELEWSLNGKYVRLLDVLEALALTELSKQDARKRNVDGLLCRVHRGQFDNLAATWPTLREFLRVRALLRPDC